MICEWCGKRLVRMAAGPDGYPVRDHLGNAYCGHQCLAAQLKSQEQDAETEEYDDTATGIPGLEPWDLVREEV